MEQEEHDKKGERRSVRPPDGVLSFIHLWSACCEVEREGWGTGIMTPSPSSLSPLTKECKTLAFPPLSILSPQSQQDCDSRRECGRWEDSPGKFPKSQRRGLRGLPLLLSSVLMVTLGLVSATHSPSANCPLYPRQPCPPTSLVLQHLGVRFGEETLPFWLSRLLPK